MTDYSLAYYGRKILLAVFNLLTILFCLVMLGVLTVNMTIFVKKVIGEETTPGFMGVIPLIVESGSMEPIIQMGDLILIQQMKTGAGFTYEEDSVIAYRDSGNIVTHRIIEKQTDAMGEIIYVTQGDANNTADSEPVKIEDILGTYRMRIPGLGTVVNFMQTPSGIALFVVLPLLIYILVVLLQKNRRLHRETDRVKQLELQISKLQLSEGESLVEKETENQTMRQSEDMLQ